MNHTNFTSETLRLEPLDSALSNPNVRDSDRTNSLHVQAAVLSASQNFQKKKVSSFQITSIRPTSRSSNDGGDDSENDTEDTSDMFDSSRVTCDFDQETPSFSEDISKAEDLLGSGPVIPASSQYGITALVQPTGTGGMMTARFPQGVTVNVTEGGLALAKADGEPDDLDNWQKRFKIVKIDSNKPFKRGRWVCLDFMDSPALNAAGGKVEEMPKLVVSNIISDSESSDPSGVLEIPFALSAYAPSSSQSNSNQTPGQSNTPAPSTQVHGGTLYTNNMGQPIQVVIPGYAISPQGPVISSSCQPSSQASTTSQSTIAGSNSIHSNIDVSVCGLNSVPNIAVSIQPGIILQNMHNASQNHTQPVTVSMQAEQAQGISLTPANSSSNISNIAHGIQSQGVGISSQNQSSAPSNVPLVNQQSQSSHPATSQISQNIISSQQASQKVSSSQQVPQPVTSSQQISQNISTQQSQNSILQPTLQNATNQLVTGSCSNVINAAASQIFTSIPNTAVSPTPVTSPAQAQSQINAGTVQQLILTEPQQVSTSASMPSSQPPPSTLDGLTLQGVETTSTSTATPPTGVAPSDDPESFHGLVMALSNVAAGSSYGHQDVNVKYTYIPSPIFTPPLNTPPLMTDASPVIDVPAAAAATLQAVVNHREHSVDRNRAKEAPFSASTASTVAIDNKIEQAMDLVKSHLMFAVREEVDVLKEKIVELMDRINHLECENSLLRQYASPDVIQQLQTQLPHQMQQQPPHHSSTT